MNSSAELAEHATQARLALFVGMDLPAEITGLPSRADLARGLARRRALNESLSLAAVAQRTIVVGNRFEFTSYLGRELDTFGKQPQRFHQLLARLPAQTIVSTAYDNLLEQALQQAGEPVNQVVRNADLAFADPRRRTLIKLYGDLQQRDTLIVTEDDHYGLWRDREKESVLEEVRGVLRRSAVLFVGYDLGDPDFKLLWREVLDRMGRFSIGAYALWPNPPADERRVWEERRIQIVDETPLPFLEQLVAAVESIATPAAKPRPPMPDTAAPVNVQPITSRLDDVQRRHLQTVRDDHQRRLRVLERQSAQYGIGVPPQIVIEIEDIQAKIAEIDQQLGDANGT